MQVANFINYLLIHRMMMYEVDTEKSMQVGDTYM